MKDEGIYIGLALCRYLRILMYRVTPHDGTITGRPQVRPKANDKLPIQLADSKSRKSANPDDEGYIIFVTVPVVTYLMVPTIDRLHENVVGDVQWS